MFSAVSNQMIVTWSTQLLANNSYVEYGISQGQVFFTANATTSTFVDGGAGHRVLYMYRALMNNLVMNQTYGESLKIFLCFSVINMNYDQH